ncbi:MAG TPA: hypothetical protein VHT51_03000 [Micropepsaceae bacterium]|nr:hypothetical protein [Micropepsaceae bacterium]
MLAGGALAALLCGAAALLPARAADDTAKGNIPDLMAGGMGWNSAGGLTAVPGSPSPVVQDPNVKYVPNNVGGQPTWRVGDINNPNLTQFAKDGLKKANDMVAEGFAMYNRTSRCWQPGVVSLNLSPGRTYFLQTPKEVDIIWQRDQIVRHVYLDVPHSANPKPSWNGESVGHYEGDTLVVDTIGQTTKSFVDLYRTPHSDKLHVVERYRLIEGGKALQVEMTIDDPVAFVMPWKGTKRWEKVTTRPTADGNVTGTYNEEIRCMDGEMVNPLNQVYAAKLEPLPTDSNGAEQKHLSGG